MGLILGYFNYITAEKVFGNSTNTLIYTVEGINYPQAVWDTVYAIQHPTEETTEEEGNNL